MRGLRGVDDSVNPDFGAPETMLDVFAGDESCEIQSTPTMEPSVTEESEYAVRFVLTVRPQSGGAYGEFGIG
jgi:hypothetical protein